MDREQNKVIPPFVEGQRRFLKVVVIIIGLFPFIATLYKSIPKDWGHLEHAQGEIEKYQPICFPSPPQGTSALPLMVVRIKGNL